MAVTPTIRVAQFPGDGTTKSFTINFPLDHYRDLRVFVGTTAKTYRRDYALNGTVNRNGSVPAGFGVAMRVAPAVGETLTVYRQTPYLNPVDFAANDPFPVSVLENAYDRVTMLLQETRNRLERSILLPITTPVNPGLGPVAKRQFIAHFAISGHLGSGVYRGYFVHQSPRPGTAHGWRLSISPRIDSVDIAELNGCTTVAPGTVVPCLALENSTGGISYRFAAPSACGSATVYANYEFFNSGAGLPSFVVDKDQIQTGTTTLADQLASAAAADYTALSLSDAQVLAYTGQTVVSSGSSTAIGGTCWRWLLVNKPATYTGTLPVVGADVGLAEDNGGPFYTTMADAALANCRGRDSGVGSDPEEPVDCDQFPDDPSCKGEDPDPDPEPDIYVRYRRCSDSALVDLWRAERIAGVVQPYDFTTAVEIDSVCYRASTIKADTPGTLIDESAVTNEFVDCTECDDAPASCPYASTSEGPQRLRMTLNGPDAEGRGAAAGTFTIPYSEAVSLGFAPLVKSSTLLIERTGNCQWDAVSMGATGGTGYGNTSGVGADLVPVLDSSGADITRLGHTSGKWTLRLDFAMTNGFAGGRVATYWKKETGATPLGVYVPDTSASAWLSAGTITVDNAPYVNPPSDGTASIVTVSHPVTDAVYIPRGTSAAVAKSAFLAAVADPDVPGVYFDYDLALTEDFSFTLTRDDLDIGWYDSDGMGTTPPILRGKSDGSDIMLITVSGQRSGLRVFGLTFDGRHDGSTLYRGGGIDEQRVGLGIRRPHNDAHTKDTNTLTDAELVDNEIRYIDQGIQLEDQWCSTRKGRGELPSRALGYGMFTRLRIHKNKIHHITGADSHSIGISCTGARQDGDVEIYDNVGYKIGFHDERNVTPSQQLLSLGYSDPSQYYILSGIPALSKLLNNNGSPRKPNSCSEFASYCASFPNDPECVARTGRDCQDLSTIYDSNKREHFIYCVDNGNAGPYVHHNTISDVATTAIQMRCGGRFEYNVVVRTPMLAQLQHEGSVSYNVCLDMPDIAVGDASEGREHIIVSFDESGPRTITDNLMARVTATRGTSPMKITGALAPVVTNNTLVGIRSGSAGCGTAEDQSTCNVLRTYIALNFGRFTSGGCRNQRDRCTELAQGNGNIVYAPNTAAATALAAAIPTLSRATIEADHLGRTHNTWTAEDHGSESFRQSCFEAL